MIDDRLLIFLVILILTYVFEHKILPQIGLVAISMIEISIHITGITITASDALYIFLFVINIIYIAFMIFVSPQETDINATQ
jgi:hypothetical protein